MIIVINKGVDPRTQPSFSLGNRVARQLWSWVYLIFFRLSPRPAHRYRAALLKLFGAKLGKNCHVYPSAKIWAPWNLVMGDNAALGDGVICYSMAMITIEKDAIVSQGAHLCAGSHDYESHNFQLYSKPIVIGAQAWVCADAFVGPGVTIGKSAVLGARAVAMRDVPSWAVCTGNPFTIIKLRRLQPTKIEVDYLNDK